MAPKSVAWNHFEKLDGNKAKCIRCDKIIPCSGGTTNMFVHLKNYHNYSPGKNEEDDVILVDPPTQKEDDGSNCRATMSSATVHPSQPKGAESAWHINKAPTPSSAGNCVWNEEQTMRLIHLYRERPWLWDVTDIAYSSRMLRRKAYKDLAEAMGDGLTYEQVSKKISDLRRQYRIEMKRFKKRISKDPNVKSQLKWFTLMYSFLKNANPANTDDGMEDIEAAPEDAETTKLNAESEDDARPISEFVDIKMEIKVEPEPECSTNSDDLTDTATPIIPIEEESPKDSENGLLENRKWTTEESFKFVSLLRAYPIFPRLLNDETETIDQNEYEKVLQEISLAMHLPKERLQKRLKPYRITYQQEIKKIQNDKNYKPNLVWWPLVQEYLDTHEKMKATKNKLDTAQNEPLKKKRKKQPSSLKEKNIWSLKHNVRFLRLYGAHRCLWDQNNPHFSSSKMRNAAHEDIATAMGGGLDADYVAKKIQTLRILYMKHRKRMIEDIKQNREPSFKTLLWFPLADSFLRPHVGLRCIAKGEPELPQFDYEYVCKNLHSIDPSLLEDLNTGCI